MTEGVATKPPPRRRRWVLLVLLLLAAFVVGKGFFIVQAGYAVYGDYESLRPLLGMSTAELAQAANAARWEALISRSEADLRLLRDEAGVLLRAAPLLGWVPYYGGDLAQAPALIEYAIEAMASVHSAFHLYHAAVAPLPPENELSRAIPRGPLVLQVLTSVQPEAEALKDQLDRMTRTRQAIEIQMLSPRSAALLRRADQALALANAGLPALAVLPELLGAQGTRRYLVLAQNNDELRATGGYISGIGVIEVREGKVTQVSYRDSYAVENLAKPHPWPPRPLTEYMGAQMWMLRDANWSPDFPTSARTIEQLYELNQGARVDGVMAIDLPGVQRLVAALGPLNVPGFAQRVDGQNVAEQMEYFFLASAGKESYGEWWSHRKDFMAALVQAMMARLNGEGGAVNLPAVGQAVWSSLATKDLLIYLNDPRAARVLHDLHWDGALPDARSGQDVVGIVDSNVGFSKADRKIARQFDYRIELRPGEEAMASVRIRYENQNPPSSEPCVRKFEYQATYADMQNTCYWDFVRLYAPAGSHPIGASGNTSATLESPEQGYTVMSAYFVLPRGQARELRFDYRIPLIVRTDAPSEYSLTWIKQPGRRASPLRVSLVLPRSLRFLDATLPPVARDESTLVFELPTDRDATLSVRLAPTSASSPFEGWDRFAGP